MHKIGRCHLRRRELTGETHTDTAFVLKELPRPYRNNQNMITGS